MLKKCVIVFFGDFIIIFSFSDGSRCWGPAECRGQGGGNLQQDGRQLGWKSDQVLIEENTFYKSNSFVNQSLVKGFQSYPHSFKARVCSMLRQRSEDGRPALPPVQNIAAYQFHKLKYSTKYSQISLKTCANCLS